jgi:hypothetical protein
MKKIYLYLKELKCGLKYLGITTKDPYKYKGSGLYWKRHLKFHNILSKDIKTTILLETSNESELRDTSLYYSNLWDIVNNEKFLNLIPESGIGTLGFKFSEDVKSKMNLKKKGVKLSDEHKRNLSLSGKGRKKTDEWKENMKGSKNPFYNKTHSKEVLDIIIKANKGYKRPIEQTIKSIYGRSKPVIQLTLNGDFVKEWGSSKEIENILGYSSSCITGCCKGRYKKSKGFKWKYKYENNKTNNQQNLEEKTTN